MPEYLDEVAQDAHLVRTEATEMRVAWKRAGVILACWTLYGLLMSAPYYYDSAASGSPVTWADAAGSALYSAWTWAALTPFVLWLVRRLPLDGQARFRNAALHFVTALVVVIAHLLFVRYTTLLFQQPLQMLPATISRAPWTVAKVIVAITPYDFVVYCVVAAMGYAVDFFGRYQERDRSLERASLLALKAQLNPHLLYNTLHAISELGYQNPEAADEVMAQLSDLLRLAFDGDGTQEVTLEDELVFTRKYLGIQEVLLGDRLAVRYDIDPSTTDLMVPNLVLQPLIENAVVHGIAPHATRGWLEVSSNSRDSHLELTVSNSCTAVPHEWPPREGVGLANTRQRLAQLYGNAGHLDLESDPQQNRFVATVYVPITRRGSKHNERDKNTDRRRRFTRASSRAAVSQ